MARPNKTKAAAVEAGLRRIEDADREALGQLWQDAFGAPLPKGRSRPVLRRRLATEHQAVVFGGLTPAERRQLHAHLPETKRGATCEAEGEAEPRESRPPNVSLSPGTCLVRVWHGKTYEAEVLEGGRVRIGDEVHRSLSAAARAITGTRWSGPAFFGLTDRKKEKAPR